MRILLLLLPVLTQAALGAPDHFGVTTCAGTPGVAGFEGDGGPASKAKLRFPTSVDVGPDGSVYIADAANHRIRRVLPGGTIESIAGTGEPGFSGDNGPAIRAQLNHPYGIRVAPDGTLYISDQRNHRIRRIFADGTIKTIAGNGVPAFAGDGGPATAASLWFPDDVAVTKDGSIFIADSNNQRIRQVDCAGLISTVAGTGKIRYNGEGDFSGDGGKATEASLFVPASLAVSADGSIVFGDLRNHAVRRVDPAGIVSTMIGLGRRGYNGDQLTGTTTLISEPGGVAVAPDGAVWFTDGGNSLVRRITSDRRIQTIAGSNMRGFADSPANARAACFGVTDHLAIAADGSVYVADHSNHCIRRIAPLPGPGQLSPESLLADMRSAYAALKPCRLVVHRDRIVPSGEVRPLHAVIQYASRDNLVVEMESPVFGSIKVVADSCSIVTIESGRATADSRPFALDTMNLMVPFNIEVFALYDWDRQLSIVSGGKMNREHLSIQPAVPWLNRDWIVLSETTLDVRADYYVDPRDFLIHRTTLCRPGEVKPYFDSRVTEISNTN